MPTIINDFPELKVVNRLDWIDYDGCKAYLYETEKGTIVIDYRDTDENEVFHRRMWTKEYRGVAIDVFQNMVYEQE